MKNLVRKYFYADCSWTAPGGVTRVDVALQPLTPIFLSISNEHATVLDNSGCGWGIGCGASGYLGTGNTTSVCQPTPMACPYKWRSLQIGDVHGIGLRDTGDVYTWGDPACGKLGIGSVTGSCVPILVCCGLKWKQVTAGATHSLGITCTGDGYAWGSNNCGRLGVSGLFHCSECLPTPIDCSFKWRALAGGSTQSMGIDVDGNGYAWGGNGCGRLGTGSQTNTCQPTPICCNFKWRCLITGDSTSYGITCSGDLYGWGNNACGQIGDGTKTNRCQPTLVCCGLKWKAVFTGRMAAGTGVGVLAITESSDLYGWGAGYCGRLGTNTCCAYCLPTPVCCGFKWKYATTGNPNSLGVTTDGDLYSWGSGLAGSGGDGTANPMCQPTPVCCGLLVSQDAQICRRNFQVTPGCSYCLLIFGKNPQFNFDYVAQEYCADAMVLEYWT